MERLKLLRNLDQAILTAESPRAIARVALEHLQRLVDAPTPAWWFLIWKWVM
jgi:hypothetical protein